MGKLPAVYRSVKPACSASLSLDERRQINARAVCPWCGARMFLDRTGQRLLCVDVIYCAGVLDASQAIRKARKGVAQ